MVLDKLATTLNRKDEAPNIALAEEIVVLQDQEAVQELIVHLQQGNSHIQSDCIKVLYEIADRQPSLVAAYHDQFLRLLQQKNNRLVWGAMTALDAIALENVEATYAALDQIIIAMEQGSVITKDHGMNILIKLSTIEQYATDAFAQFIKQLQSCPTNQLPKYAEDAVAIINAENKDVFLQTLTARLDEIEKDTKRKRVERVMNKWK